MSNTNMECLHLPSSLPLQKQNSHISKALYQCWLSRRRTEEEGCTSLLGEETEHHFCTTLLYGMKRRNFLSLMLEPSSNNYCCSIENQWDLKISGTYTLAVISAGDYEQCRTKPNMFILSISESHQTWCNRHPERWHSFTQPLLLPKSRRLMLSPSYFFSSYYSVAKLRTPSRVL